jgi:dUTP pyrophosphatase
MKVKIKKLSDHAQVPRYATPGAAGFDLYANNDVPLAIPPFTVGVVPTGLAFEIPPGFELQVRVRGGTGKKGIMKANAPGTVDSDYRGEVFLLLYNGNADKPFVVNRGDRLCQGLVTPVEQVEFEEVAELGETQRGEGRFHSTGT